jgi:hypothetical protein
MKYFFKKMPGWVNGLMWARNRVVSLVGLKTSRYSSTDVKKETEIETMKPGGGYSLFIVQEVQYFFFSISPCSEMTMKLLWELTTNT